MPKPQEKAAYLQIVEDGSRLEIVNGPNPPEIGIRASVATGRLTFDKQIDAIVVVSEKNKTKTVTQSRGKPIEIAIPPVTPVPSEGIRIRFRTLTGKEAIIFGLRP